MLGAVKSQRETTSDIVEVMTEAGRNGDYRKVLASQRKLLDELLSSVAQHDGEPGPAFARITEIASQVVDAGRVGLWVFDEGRTKITCLDLYIQRDGRHVSHSVVQRSDVPRYFEAVANGEIVAAEDAYTDPRTNEFAEGYLPAYGVGAMLDVPITSGRDLAGVMCVEHIGDARKWLARERLLASTLADCAGVVLGEVAKRSNASSR